MHLYSVEVWVTPSHAFQAFVSLFFHKFLQHDVSLVKHGGDLEAWKSFIMCMLVAALSDTNNSWQHQNTHISIDDVFLLLTC